MVGTGEVSERKRLNVPSCSVCGKAITDYVPIMTYKGEMCVECCHVYLVNPDWLDLIALVIEATDGLSVD